MLNREAWYIEAGERELSEASKAFSREPNMENLTNLIRAVKRAGQDQPLWDAVSKVDVQYEERLWRYDREDVRDDWNLVAESSWRSYNDDMAWFTTWYINSPGTRWVSKNTLVVPNTQSRFKKAEKEIRIFTPEQAEMVRALVEVYKDG